MRGIQMIVSLIVWVADFTEQYIPQEGWDDKTFHGYCEHCFDSGWFRPATFDVEATYSWDLDEKEHKYSRKVCDQHLIAETENFRDIGR